MRRAICVGINDYGDPGLQLYGCENDAKDWASLLRDVYEYREPQLVVDGDATRKNLLESIARLARATQSGEAAVITFSGHGTWEPDGPPFDELDGKDEAWCARDGNLIDDDLRVALDAFPADARLVIVSDTCHAGTVTRGPSLRAHARRRAALNPTIGEAPCFVRPLTRAVFSPTPALGEVLLASCRSDELSYDAQFEGRYNGAFSWHAIDLLRRRPRQTYLQLWETLRLRLPSVDYPQTPQLEGGVEAVGRMVFE
ncbi:MAG: caspase family protein [Planctomycetales bacterium]|nr:caspase family protein [Planctomycetales bacterium]